LTNHYPQSRRPVFHQVGQNDLFGCGLQGDENDLVVRNRIGCTVTGEHLHHIFETKPVHQTLPVPHRLLIDIDGGSR
jgi:peptide methionine sulfoxide reductase MsrB